MGANIISGKNLASTNNLKPTANNTPDDSSPHSHEPTLAAQHAGNDSFFEKIVGAAASVYSFVIPAAEAKVVKSHSPTHPDQNHEKGDAHQDPKKQANDQNQANNESEPEQKNEKGDAHHQHLVKGDELPMDDGGISVVNDPAIYPLGHVFAGFDTTGLHFAFNYPIQEFIFKTEAPQAPAPIVAAVTAPPVTPPLLGGTNQFDLSITKTDGTDTAIPGTCTTYTIVVTNLGTNIIFGQSVTDHILSDAGSQFTSATWTATSANGAFGFSASGSGDINDFVNLPGGATVTYTVHAQISPDATGNLVNTATVNTPPGDHTNNNTSTDTDILVPTGDLAITKTHISYTNNQGCSPCSYGEAQWCNNDGGGVINNRVTNNIVESEQSSGCQQGCGAQHQHQYYSENSDSCNSNFSTTHTQVADSSAIIPGGEICYTVIVTNNGPSNVVGAEVIDNLLSIAGLTNFTWTATASGGAAITSGGESGTGNIDNIVNLAVGSSITYHIFAEVNSNVTGTITNTATVTPPNGFTDTNLSNNSATDTTIATPQGDLCITKTDYSQTAIPGESTTYTIVVTNAGPSDVIGATVLDHLTGVVGLGDFSWSVVSTSGSAVITSGGENGANVDINNTVNLTAGSSITYQVIADIKSDATGTLTNTATVTAPDTFTDTNPNNNSATDTDCLTPQISLSVVKTDGIGTVSPIGYAVTTYTITVSNNGPSDATNQTVTDHFSSQFIGDSWTATATGGASGFSASGTGDINDIVNLPTNSTIVYTVTATISPYARGDLVNTATVGDHHSTDSDIIAVVTKSDDGGGSSATTIYQNGIVGTFVAGTDQHYYITINNTSSTQTLTGEVKDFLTANPNFELVGWTQTNTGAIVGGLTAGGPGDNIDNMISLLPNTFIAYTITVHINDDASPLISNQVDFQPSDGALITAVDTDHLINLDVVKNVIIDGESVHDDNIPVAMGTPVTFEILVTNSGDVAANGVIINDLFPIGLDPASVVLSSTTGTADYNPITGVWNIGTIGAGVTDNIKITANINIANGYIDGTHTAVNLAGVTNAWTGTEIHGFSFGQAYLTGGGNLNLANLNSGTSHIFDYRGASDNGIGVLSPGQTANTGSNELEYKPGASNNQEALIIHTEAPAVQAKIYISSLDHATDSNGGEYGMVQTFNAAGVAGVKYVFGPASALPGSEMSSLTAGAIYVPVTYYSGENAFFTITPPASFSYLAFTALPAANGTLGGFDVQEIQSLPQVISNTAILPDSLGGGSSEVSVNPTPTTLSISKSDGILEVGPGQHITYTINIQDTGTTNANNVTVIDTLPPGFMNVTSPGLPAGVTFSTSSGIATWTFDGNHPLTPGQIVSLQLSGTVPNNVAGNNYQNIVLANASNADTVTASDTDTFKPAVHLIVTKDDHVTALVDGDYTTYTITVQNTGPSTLTNAQISDMIPTEFKAGTVTWTVTSKTGGATDTTSSGSGNISDTITLPSGAQIVYSLTGQINPANQHTSVTNTVTVTPQNGYTVTGNTSATDTDTLSQLDNHLTAKISVDEGALPTGNDQGVVGAVTFVAGSFASLVTVPPGNVAHFSFDSGVAALLPNNLTSAGSHISFTVNGAANLLTAKDASNNTVFTLQLSDDGTYSFNLFKPIDHPSTTGNVILDLDLGGVVKVMDNFGANINLSSNDVILHVTSDAPIARNEVNSTSIPGVNTNLILTIDVSTSMDTSTNVTGMSRLAVEKAALSAVLAQYQSIGNVAVQIVTFNSSATDQVSAWTTVANAKSIIAGLTTNTSTNYHTPIDVTTPAAFATSGKIAGAQNISIFTSDGMPNVNLNFGQPTLTAAETTAWHSFLTTNHINSLAFGISSSAVSSALAPIGYNGLTGTDNAPVIITNLAQLTSTIQSTTASGTIVSGNLITDASTTLGLLGVSFGADQPGRIHSISIPEGNTYTLSADGTTITKTGSNPGETFTYIGNLLTITAAASGESFTTFSINMQTGAYTNHLSANFPANGHEIITYTVSDFNGAISPAATLDIAASHHFSPVVLDDNIITNISGTAVIPDYAFLANDKEPQGGGLSVTAVSGPAGTAHGAIGVTFQGGSDGSFTETTTSNANGALSNIGVVSVDHVNGQTLNAIGIGSILVSAVNNSGNTTTLQGAEGNDVLISGGGSGATVLNGAGGNDTLKISAGSGHFTADGGSLSNGETNILDLSSATGPLNFTLSQGNNVQVNLSSVGLGGSGGNQLTYSHINGVIGTNNADTITGSTGNDIIKGNGGADTLSGGVGANSGSDTFVFTSADAAGVVGHTVTITNFDAQNPVGGLNQGDILDISQILKGVDATTSNDVLAQHLKITSNGTDTDIAVKASVADPSPQVIIHLNAVNINAANTPAGQAQAIGDLITQGHMQAHH